MQFSYKKILPHVLVIVGFIILALAYFSPVLKGEQILQSDIVHYMGMAKQQTDFKVDTGEETYWTNSAFGGMPTYQLGARYPHNYIKKLDLALRFLPRPADYLFLYFIGFYILLLSLKVDYRLSALGALTFGFSTYLIIILGVGHNSKAHAIAYMPLVLSGIMFTFRRKYVLGFLLTAVGMALELVANHFQMTYYLMLLVMVIGVVYLIDAYRKALLPHYLKSVGIMVTAVVLAVGLNATNIMATQEYVKESTRGKSELTINPDGSPKEASSGLSKDYITEYSYGFLESFNLYIPRLLGGGNREDVGKDSELYQFYLKQGATPLQAKDAAKNAPTYWGTQPIVEAPAYVGAVILFLFVFAMFLVRGRLKWWLLGGVLMSLVLSWGKNWFWGDNGDPENNPITNFMINYMPLYDKFRAVSSIQVILELCIPVLGMFGLVKLFNAYEKEVEKFKALKYTVIITAGLSMVFLLFKSLGWLDFVGGNDGYYRQEAGLDFVNAIREDRKTIFTKDTLRTLILVLLSAGTVFMFLKKKLNETKVVVIFAILILFDLIGVDRRYVNTDNFVSARQVEEPYQPTRADMNILKDKSHFRVFDLTSAGAKASYFHNSLSGYHAAKLKRFDDVYNFYVLRNNINVLNMLNTRYIIAEDEKRQPYAYVNEDTNGNAWFVEELKEVASANEEIKALDSLDNKNKAIYTKSQDVGLKSLPKTYKVDSLASIKIMEYKPNHIKYDSKNLKDGFAVFSEVHYGKGWQAYVDDEPVVHHRVNYLLRGLNIPKGRHIVEFKFEPQVVETGSKVSLASSIVFVLLLFGGMFYRFKKEER